MLTCPPTHRHTQWDTAPFLCASSLGFGDGHCTHRPNGAEMDSTARKQLVPLGLWREDHSGHL